MILLRGLTVDVAHECNGQTDGQNWRVAYTAICNCWVNEISQKRVDISNQKDTFAALANNWLNVCFYGFTDSVYTLYFTSFISFNDSIPANPYVSGYQFVNSNGVTTVHCTQSNYLLIVGRYVTVLPYSTATWCSVLTVCEVNVIGVRQDISADGNYS